MNDIEDEPTAIMAVGSDVPPVVLGYYICVVATRAHQPGQYVRVTRTEPDGAVHYQRRDQSWIYDRDGFLAHFDYAPEGEQAVNDELLALMTEINDVSQDVADLHASLASVVVHVGGQGQEAAGMEGLTAIVPVTDRSPAGYKIALAQVRRLADQKQALLKEKQKELQAIMAEKMAVVTAMLAPLQEMVARIQEGIWTVNLYLGKDEQIVVLRDGARAPAETPITLRQMVLAMDQECAVAAEDGGIDARSITDFDRWIIERPEHLDQVLPEPKGVVVLVPRWDNKTYEDPWMTKHVAEANLQSYFLIRNGDWLCRIATDFIVGKTLMPRRDEFLDLFYEERTDWKTLKRERVAVEPGTRAYMEAEKRADARAKHYFRIGLILQGLIDRTTVFHPLPGPVQVTKAEAYDQGWIQLIADAELALGDGHERYKDWVRRINSALDVGMRIIGNFGGWNFDHNSFGGLADKNERHPRITPSGAEWPDSLMLHTLEGKRDSGYYFLYKRGEIWNWDEGYHPARQRASCVVMSDDQFIVAYDAATLEEMEYYLRSRQDRHAYVHMFPVLKAAIRMKRLEAEQEAPFLLLLAGQIVERYGVDYETATAAVPELVEWYKFKNRTHRPLVGDDDGKALRMIVDEFAVRQRESQNRIARRNRGEFAGICNLVMAAHPDVLLIAHKTGSEYVALIPHNDDPVYVREVTLTSSGKREEKTWRIVDTRFKRWHVLYTSERWDGWRINASRSEYLTDPEMEGLAHIAHARSEEAARKREAQQHQGRADRLYRFLACTFDRDRNRFHVYYLNREALTPAELLLSHPPRVYEVNVDVFAWSRTMGMVAVLTDRHAESATWPQSGLPWEARQYRRADMHWTAMRDRAEKILEIDSEAVTYIETMKAAYDAARAEHARLTSLVWSAVHGLRDAWLAREEQRMFAAFLVEYRDPGLWEGHRKTLRSPTFPHERKDSVIGSVLSYLVERGVDLHGMTFGDALLRYQARDGGVSEDEARQLAKIMPTDLDDLVMQSGDGK